VLSSFVVSLQEQIGWWVWRVAALPTRATAGCSIAALIAAVAAGCIKAPETALERLMEARRLGADLLVQLTKAADASNRAVMADTDEASIKFAREAEQDAGGPNGHRRAQTDSPGPRLRKRDASPR
jgi:hypothetical protein